MNRRYLLVCRGPNCRAQGSQAIRERLQKAIASAGNTDRDATPVVLPYSCFDRCGRGPNAVLYPDGTWYEALDEADVPEVARHALGGASPAHLIADVEEEHAQRYYQLFEEIIPELESEEQPSPRPGRRWWPFR